MSWKDWLGKDKVIFVFVFAALVVAMVMGASNVYSNLIASGVTVFIEKPWLAVFLSMLVPTGSAAIKFIINFMEHERSRKRYALWVNVLTILSLLVWSILFALNFTGVSGGIDWESMGESHSSGAALVWIQLFAEMLIASSLFLVIEDIYMRYSPDFYPENPEYVANCKALESYEQTHEKLRDKRNKRHGRLVELNAERLVSINEKTADYINLRARFSAANNFNV